MRFTRLSRIVLGFTLMGAIGISQSAGATGSGLVITTTPPTNVVAGNLVTVASSGGAGTGAVTYKVTGAHCAITATTGILSATAAATCVVKATKAASRGHLAATSPGKTFTFAADAPTHTNYDSAKLVSVVGAPNASILDGSTTDPSCYDGSGPSSTSVCGNSWFIATNFLGYQAATNSQADSWLFNYVHQGSIVQETWHVNSSNGLPLANTTVTLLTSFGTNSPAIYTSLSGTSPDQYGNLVGTTNSNGDVTFTLVAPRVNSGLTSPSDFTTPHAALTAEGSDTYNRMMLVIGTLSSDTDPSQGHLKNTSGTEILAAGSGTVTQASDLADFILIP
jgi:hypothetical protein